LTTVTTIFGLLPLTLNIANGSEFWVPLGIAIISGLLVASVLTLVFVPVLYSIVEGARRGWISRAVRSGPRLAGKDAIA
jgi:HAE1 family hydrophobic/amphiphilic exporter-1